MAFKVQLDASDSHIAPAACYSSNTIVVIIGNGPRFFTSFLLHADAERVCMNVSFDRMHCNEHIIFGAKS